MDLDERGLTRSEYSTLVRDLMAVTTLRNDAERAIFVNRSDMEEIRGELPSETAGLSVGQYITQLWQTCVDAHFVDSFLDCLERVQHADHDLINLRDRIKSLRERLQERADFEPLFGTLIEIVKKSPDWEKKVTRTWGQFHMQLPIGVEIKADGEILDLLRELFHVPQNGRGQMFPFFDFVDDLLTVLFSELNQEQALSVARGTLDAIAKTRGCTEERIAERRNQFKSNAESAIIVQMKPEPLEGQSTILPADWIFEVTITTWLPHDPDIQEAIGEVGKCGFAVGGTPKFCKGIEEAKQLTGKVLTEMFNSQTIFTKRGLVEFLVPIPLLNEEFEQIPLQQSTGPGLGTMEEETEKPLCEQADVVVRALEREFFHKTNAGVNDHWQRRWGTFRERTKPTISPFVLWAQEDERIRLRLGQDEHRDLCVVCSRFVPIWPDSLKRLATGLIQAGVPVAVWMRTATTPNSDVETALTALLELNSLSGFALRSKVNSLRLDALNNSPNSVAKVTLFWDDPQHRFDPQQPDNNPTG